MDELYLANPNSVRKYKINRILPKESQESNMYICNTKDWKNLKGVVFKASLRDAWKNLIKKNNCKWI